MFRRGVCTLLKPGTGAPAGSLQAGLGPERAGLRRARRPRPAQPPARAGGAPCPFKEADRTTRTFLTGGIRANSDNFQGAKRRLRFPSNAGPSCGAAQRGLRAGGLWAWAPRVSLPRNRPGGLHLVSFRPLHSPSWSKVELACRGPSARMSIRISASQYARSPRLR